MAYGNDEEEALLREAALDSRRAVAEMTLADDPAIQRANAATQEALDRAQRLARRDPNTYNPDRPSTWSAPDNPNLQQRARNIQPTAEQTAIAQAQRQAVTGAPAGAELDPGRASIKARSDAAMERLDTAEGLAARRAQGGRDQFASAYAREGQRVGVTKRNPAHASTKRATDALGGTGQVYQALGPDGQPMFQTQVVDEPILGADGQPMPDPMNPQGPPLTRQVEKQVPVMRTDEGLIGEERTAAEGVRSAELDREIEQTNLLRNEYMQRQQIQRDMMAQQMAQRQRTEAVRQTVDDSYRAVQKATQLFNAADDIDPDKGWGEKGVGSKIMAIIASGLLGFAGMDPMQHINGVINNSIDAQKANLAKRQAQVGEARGQQAAAESAYQQIRAQVADESVADETYRIAALESIKAQALARLQDANVKVYSAQTQAFMNAIDQQLVEKRRNVELAAATNWDKRTVYVDPRTPGQRRLDMKAAESGLRTMEKGGDQAIDIVAKREEQERGVRGKIREKQAEQEFAGDDLSEGEAKLLGGHVDNIKKAGELVAMTDAFTKKWGDRDIPGRGISRLVDWATPNDVAEMEAELGMIEDQIGRLQSQGAITEDELKTFRGWTRGGVGDASLVKNVGRIGEFANRTVVQSEAALPKRLRPKFRNVDPDVLPSLQPNIIGAGGALNREPGTGVVSED